MAWGLVQCAGYSVIAICRQPSTMPNCLVGGLAYIHAQGAVHRDLKPSNIMVLETEEGIETTVLDLGLAKFRHLHSASITQTGATIGTANICRQSRVRGCGCLTIGVCATG